MRRVIILLSVLIIASSSFAQKGFEVGLRGMFKNNWLINNQDFAEGPALDFKATFGQSYGISLGYNFTDYIGVRTNVLYAQTGQKYEGDFQGATFEEGAYSNYTGLQYTFSSPSKSSTDYTAEVSLKYIKVPLMFRANSFPYKGAFFSFLIGPQLNYLSGATHYINDTKVNYKKDMPVEDFSTKKAYNEIHFGAVMGLGADISLTDLLKLNINFRFDYSFQDIENKNATWTIANSEDKFWDNDSWDQKRGPTNAASGGLMIGLTYTFQ